MTLEQAIQLAGQHAQAGQLDTAENITLQIIQQMPNAAAGWNLLGLIMAARQRMEEAQNAYQEAIRLEPASIEAWSNWSLLLRVQGKFGQAIECLQHAATLQAHPGIFCNLATVLLEAGQDLLQVVHPRVVRPVRGGDLGGHRIQARQLVTEELVVRGLDVIGEFS